MAQVDRTAPSESERATSSRARAAELATRLFRLRRANPPKEPASVPRRGGEMASLAPSGVAAMSASLATVGNPLRSGRQRAALPPAARTATAKRHRGRGDCRQSSSGRRRRRGRGLCTLTVTTVTTVAASPRAHLATTKPARRKRRTRRRARGRRRARARTRRRPPTRIRRRRSPTRSPP